MRYKLLTKILVSLIVILLVGFYVKSILGDTRGSVVAESFSYTRAICNETNFCQDYEIVCDGGMIMSKEEIPNASHQYSSEWEDPRGELGNLC